MDNLLDVKDLKVTFDIKRSLIDSLTGKRKLTVKAVDGVNFSIGQGEILSLVGESGSGKTTTGRAILNLVDKKSGQVLFNNTPVDNKDKSWKREFRQKAQMIFQDPYQSLNPKDMIVDIVSEPLVVNGLKYSKEELLSRVTQTLEFVGLCPAQNYLYKYPYELSGGQRQRVAIASVFIMSPDFVIADEPVSMLDASVRADILNIMVKLKEKKNTSYLFITHDLSLAWLISDRVAIMYLGRIMEIGSFKITSGDCLHPYSMALMSALPRMTEDDIDERMILEGETPSPTRLPKGCRFNPRCAFAKDICKETEPELMQIDQGHFVACHFAEKFKEEKQK